MKKYLGLALLAGLALAPVGHVAMGETLDFSNLSGWSVDRELPAAFETDTSTFAGQTVLHVGISGAQQNASSFYNYQGEQTATGAVDDYTTSLYVPATDWAGQTINTGVWAVGYDNTNAISAYAIIAYRQGQGITSGFYSFDYTNDANSGDWEFLTAAQTGWNSLDISLTPGTGVTYTVNGSNVGTTADSDTTSFNNVIIDTYNSGVDYKAYYGGVNSGGSSAATPLPQSAAMAMPVLGLLVVGGVVKRRSLKAVTV